MRSPSKRPLMRKRRVTEMKPWGRTPNGDISFRLRVEPTCKAQKW